MKKLRKLEDWKGGKQGGDVELGVAEPIVTKGWSLAAGYVIHVAGPQLERGETQPTEEEQRLLAQSYEKSLNLAVEVSFVLFTPLPSDLRHIRFCRNSRASSSFYQN